MPLKGAITSVIYLYQKNYLFLRFFSVEYFFLNFKYEKVC